MLGLGWLAGRRVSERLGSQCRKQEEARKRKKKKKKKKKKK